VLSAGYYLAGGETGWCNVKRSLAEMLFEIAVWIETLPGDYQALPPYLKDVFEAAVKSVYKAVRVAHD